MTAFPLDPGRTARLKLAVYDAFDVQHGDPLEYRRRLEHVVDLHRRLRAEQLAELGCIPRTIEGCIAVLRVAEAIVAAIGGDDA